jgi:5-oxopent-3-ene-1,2,5-tricarboxylate decarboxylase/2-hydroxyhepta-2,4-diene-1,7-dioate isomerase
MFLSRFYLANSSKHRSNATNAFPVAILRNVHITQNRHSNRSKLLVEASAVVSNELLEKYRSISNATVLGQLLKLGYTKTYMNGVRSLAPGRRLVGRAVTLRYLPSRPDLAKRVATGGHGEGFNETPRWQALEKLGPGDVFVGDAMGLGGVSTGGDVVFSRILTQGAAGLVTDGGVRDGHKVTRYGYPVFAGGSTPTVGEPNILPYEVNAPVQCGGVLVWPGDVILGDDDGIVVMPSQLAEELLPECIEHDEIEQAILEHTQKNRISPKSFYPFNDETMKVYEAWKKRNR